MERETSGSKEQYDQIESLIRDRKREISNLENRVVECISRNEILAVDIDKEYESQLTFSQRLSDRLTSFGGSWTYIILFFVTMTVWIVVNSLALIIRPFDPYPYIFLNLVLSCLSAIYAPVIMMSQNRQDAKDRVRAMHDYQVNLKAEIEIRQIHQKLDEILVNYRDRLMQIEEKQMELLKELRGQTGPGKEGR